MGFLHPPVSSWGCSFLGGSGSWDSIILHSQDESSQLVVSGTLGPAGLAALWNISCYCGLWVPFGHRRLLSLGLCSPPVLFLPALAAPCPAVQVPFTAAASVIVTGGLEQPPPVSVAMLPTLLPQGLSALPSSLVATTADATPLLPLPPLVFTLTRTIYSRQERTAFYHIYCGITGHGSTGPCPRRACHMGPTAYLRGQRVSAPITGNRSCK